MLAPFRAAAACSSAGQGGQGASWCLARQPHARFDETSERLHGLDAALHDRVEVCYAMIHHTATILKIVMAQLLVAAGQGG